MILYSKNTIFVAEIVPNNYLNVTDMSFISKNSRIRNHQLDVSICPVKDEKLKKIIYRIVIDGDVFWADTYEHALFELFEILCRCEVKKSKIL